MESNLKKILRALSLELRHILEGYYDDHGKWYPGDLERRLNEMGIWRDRPAKSMGELSHLTAEDKAARKVIDAYVAFREEADVARHDAVAEFVRESAYTWANRLFILRCMESRGIIDEVILQKDTYGGRSLVHNRFARKSPEACSGEDDGLFAVLFEEFVHLAKELSSLFDPQSPAVALRPSVAALKKCIALFSGRETIRGQEPATDAIFESPDALGWAYQYWNTEEKDRIFEMVRTKKGSKIEGADIIPVTQLYTEPYMVKFLVQNSLGAIWMGMHPESKLCEKWEYYVKNADHAPVEKKPVSEIAFLDPACGSGHFHLEAFDLFYAMYEEEGIPKSPEEICASILNNNLFGIDIDGRAVQIATAALWMKAREKAQNLNASDVANLRNHLVATNIRLPKGKDHLEIFLQKHPEDEPLRKALEMVFLGLESVYELGSLVQIEEPVERELRVLKETFDMNKGKPKQKQLPSPEMAKPRQRELPIGVESYEVWKQRTLKRINEHFESEAQTADTFQAFFNKEAVTGLTLFHLLSQRYDVVTANPPYMGSKNMGEMLKRYVEQHYTSGKRDLYAAFILRCKELAQAGGRVAMVTQQSWMFLRSFAELRAVEEYKLKKLKAGAFRGLLRDTTIETLAHLGPGAFGEISGEVVNIVLFTLNNIEPSPEHRITAFRLIGPKCPEEKEKLMLSWQSNTLYRLKQIDFLCILNSPILYWIDKEILKIISKNELFGKFADCKEGLGTRWDERFVRWNWESMEYSKRWFHCKKGGGYRKWYGFNNNLVDWEYSGFRILNFFDAEGNLRSVPRNTHYYFRRGFTYNAVARGSLGFHIKQEDTIFLDASPTVFPKEEEDLFDSIYLVLNSRLFSYISRLLSPSMQFKIGYAALLPKPMHLNCSNQLSFVLENLKKAIVSSELTERTFDNTSTTTNNPITSLLHTVESKIEHDVFSAYKFTDKAILTVINETGYPVGWYALISGYDSIPEPPKGTPEISNEIIDSLKTHERRAMTNDKLLNLKSCLRSLYESGAGAKEESEETDEKSEGDEAEEEVIAGAHIPIPPETFLEELSQKLEIHPISVYWLLKEGIEKEGWRCPLEEQRITFDRFTVTVLRLLGHRWPKQIEAGEPVPEWAYEDGIIPITEGCGEKTLLELVRERIADEFSGGNVTSIEREFEEITGMSLEKWLKGPFFKRHISQFKKRPIAWQIESGDGRLGIGNRRKPKGARTAGILSNTPAFSCLLYYHKLGATTLLDIRRLYVDKFKGRYETELRTLEGIHELTAEQSARKIRLEGWIDELKSLDQKLDEVARIGFCPENLRPILRQYAINDAMLSLVACWLRKLSQTIQNGTLGSWQEAASTANLHQDFSKWISDAIAHLDHHCAAVCPEMPNEKEFENDPTPADLAPKISNYAKEMVKGSLSLACDVWWKQFDDVVLLPIRQQINQKKEKLALLQETSNTNGTELIKALEKKSSNAPEVLKGEIKDHKNEIERKTSKSKIIRNLIESWEYPDAETWEDWLSKQPLFDKFASLDGKRLPPKTTQEFIEQEGAYYPDINDGVRVNIAPLQKAGLLASEVLPGKDLDKAIADRAEWRADERRWCREGKLPMPGWWK